MDMGHRRRERRRHPYRARSLATTNAQGAANFPAELLGAFAGLNVAIVADRDLAGYQRAINLHERLQAAAAQVVVLIPALDTDKADVTDHVNAGLWNRGDTFGGLTPITPAELQALGASAKAHWAADRFDTALREARAHQDQRGMVPGSARNAARWFAEANEQLRTVQHIQQDLQRQIEDQHLSPTVRAAAHAVNAILERLTNDYRHNRRRPATHTPTNDHARLKESA